MEVDAGQITSVAKGISDLGMMAVTAGVFLLLSMGLMISCFAWFKSLINGIIDDNRGAMQELLDETRAQNEKLTDISEGLRPETQLRIKNTANVFFDLAVEKVCRIIKKVREENHIVDHEATAAKIRTLLHNIHEDRNTRFESYTYRGRKLSEYTDIAWVEKVASVVEDEIYNSAGPNNGRAYTNVKAAYDDIKLDFYKRLSR